MIRTELIRPLPELLADHADARGQQSAFIDDTRAVTWGELEARTARLAGHLGARVERGRPVAICMGNRIEALESYLGVARAGNVGVFLNPAASDHELAYMIEDSGAEVMISDARQRERTWRAAERAPAMGETIVVDPAEQDASLAYEPLVAQAPTRSPADDLGLDEPAWMLYTSGTTGRPKGVVLTQRSCLWVVAACWAPIAGLGADDRMLSALPLFHSYALDLTVLGIVATGATIRLLSRFSARRVIELLRSDPFTLMPGVPTMFHYLVEHLNGERLEARALQRCLSAGAIMPAALTDAFERAAGVPVLDGYGITETSTMVTMNWPDGGRPPGSCGLPVPGCAVRLVDPNTDEDVDPGEEGELIVRGPQVMLGYHNKARETAEVLRGGWYHSGDLARSDESGYLTITGRIKELIIRGGENIYPAEVEQAIVEHPAVSDAAVVGRPDEALGEVVVAFVVAAEPELDHDALRQFAAERLAEYKLPAEFRVVEEIPRTGSGKIMRHRLRAELE
jgi:acyl-CoA synthetase (AMP-forming)/AMP-acid ligase II